MYHLFYGDEKGNPGTELTFFEIPMAGQTREGVNSISATSLRVPSDAALQYWIKRFDEYEVPHGEITNRGGRATLSFTDFENQRLILVSDENNTGVPGANHGIRARYRLNTVLSALVLYTSPFRMPR